MVKPLEHWRTFKPIIMRSPGMKRLWIAHWCREIMRGIDVDIVKTKTKIEEGNNWVGLRELSKCSNVSEKENTDTNQGFPTWARPPSHLRKRGKVSPTRPQSPHSPFLSSVPENFWLKTQLPFSLSPSLHFDLYAPVDPAMAKSLQSHIPSSHRYHEKTQCHHSHESKRHS